MQIQWVTRGIGALASTLRMTLEAFSREAIAVDGGSVFIRRAVRGPAVLLLHGCPETSVAWRTIAPDLARDYTVIAADLPGYDDSALVDTASRTAASVSAPWRTSSSTS